MARSELDRHALAAGHLPFFVLLDRMTTEEIDQLPQGALLYQDKTSGRLIVTRNDAQEISFIHLCTDSWYYEWDLER